MCVCLRTRSNRSCLHHAVMQGHVDMVKFLLDSDPTGGKLLQLVTNNHDNALHSAIWGEQVEIARLLIERGIGMEICRILSSLMVENKNYDDSFVPDVGLKGRNDDTPLHEAARGGLQR